MDGPDFRVEKNCKLLHVRLFQTGHPPKTPAVVFFWQSALPFLAPPTDRYIQARIISVWGVCSMCDMFVSMCAQALSGLQLIIHYYFSE